MHNQNFILASMDEIVFENRNKTYGAFFLRKLYDRNVLVALSYSTLVFTALLLLPLIKQRLFTEAEVLVKPKKKLEAVVIDIPLDAKAPPAPVLPKIEVPQVKSVKFVILEVAKTDAEVKEPDVKNQKELEDASVGTQNKDGENAPELPTEVTNGVLGGMGNSEEDNQPWVGPITDEVSFPGGIKTYIQGKISQRLHEYISDKGIKGRLMISVIIAKDGSVKSAEIQAGREIPNCKLCSEEVIDIIKSMPKWSPAMNNNSPVIRRISFPIVF